MEKFEIPSTPIPEQGEAERENEFLRRCRTEIYDRETLPWPAIREDILRVERSAFVQEEAFDEEDIRNDFEKPQSIIVFERDTVTNKIVGFTYAEPTLSVYPELYPERTPSPDTAYISDTVFEPQYQKRGLLPSLLKKLEEELIRRGFAFIERDSTDDRSDMSEGEETFADKIRKNNQDRIIFEERQDSEDYGPQVYFRIRIARQE